MGASGRGAVSPEKLQVNWRIFKEFIPKLKAEGRRLGLGSVPAVVNYILAQYFNK